MISIYDYSEEELDRLWDIVESYFDKPSIYNGKLLIMRVFTPEQQRKCYDIFSPRAHPRTLKKVEQLGAEKTIEMARKDVKYISGGKTFTEEHWEVLYNALLYYEREIKTK